MHSRAVVVTIAVIVATNTYLLDSYGEHIITIRHHNYYHTVLTL